MVLKMESLFLSEKTPLPQINIVGKFLGFRQQNSTRFNIDIGG